MPPSARCRVSPSLTAAPVRADTNHGGFGRIVRRPPPFAIGSDRGNGRNGPRSTERSTPSSSSALCTTPMPLPTSSIVPPGNAPQVRVGVMNAKAVQLLIAIEP